MLRMDWKGEVARSIMTVQTCPTPSPQSIPAPRTPPPAAGPHPPQKIRRVAAGSPTCLRAWRGLGRGGVCRAGTDAAAGGPSARVDGGAAMHGDDALQSGAVERFDDLEQAPVDRGLGFLQRGNRRAG